MSHTRVEVVLVKLCAAVIVVLTLQSLTYYAAYFMAGEQALGITLLAFFLVFAIPIGMAAILWYFPATVVGTSLGGSEFNESELASSRSAIFIGVTLVGLYTFVFGLIDLFYYEAVRLGEVAYFGSGDYGSYQPTPDTMAGRYTNILQVALGVLILLGRRGLSELLSRVRGRRADAS